MYLEIILLFGKILLISSVMTSEYKLSSYFDVSNAKRKWSAI